jgi:hypothetical protein
MIKTSYQDRAEAQRVELIPNGLSEFFSKINGEDIKITDK